MIIITVLEQGKSSTVEFPVSFDIKDAAKDFWEICGIGGPLFDKAIEIDDTMAFVVTDHVLELIFERAAKQNFLDNLEDMLAPRHHNALERFKEDLNEETSDIERYGSVESQASADYSASR